MNLRTFLIIILFTSSANIVSPQNLRVELSPDGKKVDINTSDGVSTIVFKSNVKGLSIANDWNDDFSKYSDDLFSYRIKPYNDSINPILNLPVYPRRKFILESPKSNIYELEIDEIFPNTVYYYTVTLPDNFPVNLTAEYLFTKSSQHGLRFSFGKRFGGYLSYKWGKYKPSGNNIDDVTTDCDLTKAQDLGYIRTSITGGLRMGLFHPNWENYPIGLYLLVGGGYSEYGRQWQNPTQVEGNIYFYTDYIKGFDGELALQCTLNKWLTLSIGLDLLIGNGRASVDYQLGFGINLNKDKIFKKKIML